MASPSAVKWRAILANLSQPRPVAAPFLEEGKGGDDRSSFAHRACACPFLEALCLMRSIPQPLVRARGAHCKTACAQAKGNTNGIPMVVEPGACTLHHWLSRLRFHACQWPSRLRPGPATNGKAIASPSAKREAVLQCAPRARTKGRALAKHSAKRFQKRRGHGHGERKARASTSLSPTLLFSTFFLHPLARPSHFCYTCNRQQWAGPSEEARATPIPLRIERKNE